MKLLYFLLFLFIASPVFARDFLPPSHLENITASNSSIQQCYVFQTTPGVAYTVEVSNNLSNWTPQDEIYGLGGEYAVAMREFTPPPPPPPGTPPANPPTLPTNVSLRLQPASGAAGGIVVAWRSLDHDGPMIVRIAAEIDVGWNQIPIFWNRFAAYNFYFWHPGVAVAPPAVGSPLGPKDSAMLAVLEASVPAINQQIAASILHSRNAPPPAPPDPDSKRFWRVKVDWSLDTDQDGSPDWAEFEIAALGTGMLVPGVTGDAFNEDTNNDGIPDGLQLDSDGDGTPDGIDINPSDNTATFPIGPAPRYALFPITNAGSPTGWPFPLQISDKGTVLYENGTWTAGGWTALDSTSDTGLNPTKAVGINDNNQIIGAGLRQITSSFGETDEISGICYWNGPNGARAFVSSGSGATEKHAVGTYEFYDHELTPGPILSNDGHFSAFTKPKAEHAWIMPGPGYWKLPAGNGPVTEASGDHRLEYSQGPNLRWGAGHPLELYGDIQFSGFGGPEDESKPLERLVQAPSLLPAPPVTAINVFTPTPDLVLALPAASSADAGMAFVKGKWVESATYANAIDIAADGTAIGRNHGGLTAPILLNGKWTGIARTAPVQTDVFEPPSPWHDGTVSLRDTTPSGWILAKRGSDWEPQRAVMLPLRAEGSHTRAEANQDGTHTTDTAAVGVDDFSIGSETPGSAVQDRIWIMAPQGGATPIVKFKAPLNPNTPLNLSASNILFNGQDSATTGGPANPISVRAADTVTSGGERLMTLTLGSGDNEVSSVSKPIGLKIMKDHTVKVTVYKVTKLYGTSAEEEVDAVMMPTQNEIIDHLNDMFRPQINTTFSVNLVAQALKARWDANTDAKFDIQTGVGAAGEEAPILAEVPANPPAYDIRVFLVANSAPLGSDIDAYGLTLRDQRTCWVLGSLVGKNRSKSFLLDTIAHEIGHVLVGEGHPDSKNAQALGKAPLPGTKHICRLMCSGPNSDGSSRLLVKKEWDEAETWLKNRIDNGNP